MKYGFIGCGNMGGAIARALSTQTNDILLTDRSGKARTLANELGCTYGNAHEIVTSCQRVFLAVKPQMMWNVLAPLRASLKERKPLIITMAAGIEMRQITDFVGIPLPVIRIMPNTPVAVGKGMILYCCNELVTDDMLQSFLSDMQNAGKLDLLDEKLIDVGSALSGSGPAYMYLFLEAMADGAVACGLPRQKAMEYAAATMEGAAQMLLTTGEHPGALKDAVCSPGGSTIAGIQALEDHGLRGAVMGCVAAAYRRNLELGK